jgi:uncharacterized repeat protein (TIGR01451 family)
VVKGQSIDANCDGIADNAFSATPVTARPGQCIAYEVVATNEGASPVTNITVNDSVPPYTALNTNQAAVPCESAGVTGTAVAFASNPSAVSCGSASNTVAPGGTVTLRFGVQIDN